MHTILVNNDNSLSTSVNQRIIQGSNIDYMHILVDPLYEGIDMRNLVAFLTYITPISNVRNTITLTCSEELYKDKKIEYKVKLDENFTSENGDIKIWISFIDDESNIKRKTTMGIIRIQPEIEDENQGSNEPTTTSIPDSIYLDPATNEIYLTSNGVAVGDKISVDDLSETIVETTSNDGLVTVITE